MKKTVGLVLSIVMLISMCMPCFALKYGEEHEGEVKVEKEIFTDVSTDHWAYDSIRRCKAIGWFDGYPDGRFKPEDPILRREAIKVFVDFKGRKVDRVSESNYHDVPLDTWYTDYVHAGEDLIPQDQKTSKTFRPNAPMTREDTIYALVVALGYESLTARANESILNMFDDENSISVRMRPYVVVAVENGLVAGYNDATIRAQDALTRAQFAALLHRASEVGEGPDKPKAVINKITVTPNNQQNLTVGESVIFNGKAYLSDGTTESYSDLNPYCADYSNIIEIRENKITALKEGNCTIQFDNSYLDSLSIKVIVQNPKDAPHIEITNFPDVTEEENVTISGTVKDASGTEVRLICKNNNKDINVHEEKFSYTTRLSIGVNHLEFVATNSYGNQGTKQISIERTEKKPTTVEMANVVGKDEDDAVSIIKNLGLKVDVETTWDDNVSQGKVVSQSIKRGKEVEIGSTVTITVSGGKNEWVGWLDNLPNYVNEEDYVIEEKKQYRYKTLEFKTSSSANMGGWVLERQDEEWSSWSNWSTSGVGASSTRQVETREVANPIQYKTQYHYTRYYGINPATNKYVSWPIPGVNSKTYQESGWRDTPMENRGRADAIDYICFKDNSDPISVWWWNETTRTVEQPKTYKTEYRYRDKSVTYVFSRWTDWSKWMDDALLENETKKVETKTVYRYKFKAPTVTQSKSNSFLPDDVKAKSEMSPMGASAEVIFSFNQSFNTKNTTFDISEIYQHIAGEDITLFIKDDSDDWIKITKTNSNKIVLSDYISEEIYFRHVKAYVTNVWNIPYGLENKTNLYVTTH